MNDSPRTLQVELNRSAGATYTVTFEASAANGAALQIPAVSVVTPTARQIASLYAAPARHVAGYFGTVVQDAVAPFGLLDSLDSPYPIDAAKLSALVNQGVQIARLELAPYFANPERGVYDFSKIDPIVDALQQSGINVNVEIRASPVQAWASDASTQATPLYADPDDYAAFCRATAMHLAMKYPAVSKVSISDNEPNFASNWDNVAGAALFQSPDYNDASGAGDALYLRPCYAEIKEVAPNLQVFAPEMAFGGDTDAIPFLQNLYAHGCKVGVCFDGLAMHLSPYNDMAFPTSRCAYAGTGWAGRCYRDAQAVAIAHGDPRPPVIISETGYSSASTIPQGFDEMGQAFLMSTEFAALEADSSVVGVYWSYIDGNGTPPDTLFGEVRTLRSDGSHKPAFDVYHAFASL